jgi:hypothetical protein
MIVDDHASAFSKPWRPTQEAALLRLREKACSPPPAPTRSHTSAFTNRLLRERPRPVAKSSPWLHDYIAEITGFPGSRHADQVDSTT